MLNYLQFRSYVWLASLDGLTKLSHVVRFPVHHSFLIHGYPVFHKVTEVLFGGGEGSGGKRYCVYDGALRIASLFLQNCRGRLKHGVLSSS